MNGYFEEFNGNKYLTLVPTNESKEKAKKYEELWSKIRDLIKSIMKNSDNYVEKYMKIKFNTDDDLPLNKTIEIPSIINVVRAVFMKITHIIRKFLQVIQKTRKSKECDICHFLCLLNKGLKFQLNVCNGCNDLLMMSMNRNGIA